MSKSLPNLETDFQNKMKKIEEILQEYELKTNKWSEIQVDKMRRNLKKDLLFQGNFLKRN